ncbi:uncharacterized protein B0I36DRAFT_319354 [Microdochium trichocladiopsis]|uniref:Uncharacterized protein n=1 Tax=Microdochium trichocladiopsis TaxID=1682393 RepID=A0A9P8YCM3_9PEZI|nr:uncharacterized protein B0I36DRAFT_319354 [Microdochium trichocladiopsis]KAH7035916.1 hypothetical protein B0I36DRAFT_319354 [Microdochium trichocladiopsis]
MIKMCFNFPSLPIRSSVLGRLSAISQGRVAPPDLTILSAHHRTLWRLERNKHQGIHVGPINQSNRRHGHLSEVVQIYRICCLTGKKRGCYQTTREYSPCGHSWMLVGTHAPRQPSPGVTSDDRVALLCPPAAETTPCGRSARLLSANAQTRERATTLHL